MNVDTQTAYYSSIAALMANAEAVAALQQAAVCGREHLKGL